MDLAERLGQHHRIVLAQPVLEELVRHTDADGATGIHHERRGLEPGIEAVAINFRFDSGEDLIPDTGFHTRTALAVLPRIKPGST